MYASENIVDLFGLGLLIGLLIGGPLFASARTATGLLGAIAAGVVPFIVTKGLTAFQSELDAIVQAIGAHYRLAVGLLVGFAIAGIFSVVFRKNSASM